MPAAHHSSLRRAQTYRLACHRAAAAATAAALLAAVLRALSGRRASRARLEPVRHKTLPRLARRRGASWEAATTRSSLCVLTLSPAQRAALCALGLHHERLPALRLWVEAWLHDACRAHAAEHRSLCKVKEQRGARREKATRAAVWGAYSSGGVGAA